MRHDPWKALGWSRASWYRHGKPDYPYRRYSTQKEEAAKGGISVRTYQRFMRILKTNDDFLIGALSVNKIGVVEKLVTDHHLRASYERWVKTAHKANK
jgi:hypothetical protein